MVRHSIVRHFNPKRYRRLGSDPAPPNKRMATGLTAPATTSLLCDANHAARETAAGIACGLCFQVVGFLVHDHGMTQD